MAYEFAPITKTGLYFNETGPAIFENCFSITILFYPFLALPNMCDNKQLVVIVTFIWQKLSSVEQKKMLIVTNYWQPFSQIFGETLLTLARFATISYLKSIKSVYYLVLVVELIYGILLTNEGVNITTVIPK
jgi:hypothetical protein